MNKFRHLATLPWVRSSNINVTSIRTPRLIQGRLEGTETNLMHIRWEVTWTHRNQPNILGSAKGLNSGRRGHRVGHQNKPIRSSGCKRSGDAGTSRNSSLSLIGCLRGSTRWLRRPESRPLAELTIHVQWGSVMNSHFARGASDSAKNHKRQRRKRQSVTAKREKSQTPKFV